VNVTAQTLLVIAVGGIVVIGIVWSLLRGKSSAPAPDNVAQARQPIAERPTASPTVPATESTSPAVDAMAGVHAIALDDERVAQTNVKADVGHMPLLMAASSEIARIGTEPRYTPPRPSLLPQLLEAVNDEQASLRTMARTLAQDPALTSNLLRTANSALYRVSSTPIESIERAAALVGTQGIRAIIAQSLVQPLAADQNLGRFGEVMWEHSLYSASAAEAFAARAQDCDPFTAHLLGLLHGLGSVAVFRVMADAYAAQSILQPDGVTIAQALDTSAAVTAKRIAANWGLSERTQNALEAQSSAAPTGDPSPLGNALHFGRLTGATIFLCRRKQLDPPAGRAVLAANHYTEPHIDRIWDRLVLAYVTR
jgi:HD-like signal output (HDOD) protein